MADCARTTTPRCADGRDNLVISRLPEAKGRARLVSAFYQTTAGSWRFWAVPERDERGRRLAGQSVDHRALDLVTGSYDPAQATLYLDWQSRPDMMRDRAENLIRLRLRSM